PLPRQRSHQGRHDCSLRSRSALAAAGLALLPPRPGSYSAARKSHAGKGMEGAGPRHSVAPLGARLAGMSDSDPSDGVQARILATLEKMLAQQGEALAQQRRMTERSQAMIEESLKIQRESAARQTLAVDTQQRTVRLYRGVVVAGAVLIAGIVGLILWLIARYL